MCILLNITKEVDNNNLTINTASLTHRNLSNRKNSRSISLGGSISSTGNKQDSQFKKIKDKISKVSSNLTLSKTSATQVKEIVEEVIKETQEIKEKIPKVSGNLTFSKTSATLGLGNIKVGNKQLDDKKLNRNIDK
jgi:predicted DNA-binding protein